MTWPIEASSAQGIDGNFLLMRVYRRMPVGWDDLRSRLLGTGELGWLLWWIEQMTNNAAWLKRIANWPLIRYDYLPGCLQSAVELVGNEDARCLLLG